MVRIQTLGHFLVKLPGPSLCIPWLPSGHTKGGPALPWHRPACFPTGFQSRCLDTRISPASVTSSEKGSSPFQPHKSVIEGTFNCTCRSYKRGLPVEHMESWILLSELGNAPQGLQKPKPRTALPPDCKRMGLCATEVGVGRGSTRGPWEIPMFAQCLLSMY